MGADMTEAKATGRVVKNPGSKTASPEDKAIMAQVLESFEADYESDTENGVHTLTLRGEAVIQIHEVRNEDGTITYHSPFVIANQPTLKEAFEWTARQVGVKAVHETWDSRNPKTVRQSERKAMENEIAAMRAELEALRAANAALAGNQAAEEPKIKRVK